MASRGKGKDKEKQAPAPQPVQEQFQEKEVVPGKLTESQWLHLLETEDPVDIASELVEETVEVAYSIIYSHYLERHSFPYTVQQAKHSLLQIIEWQFLSRDSGEVNTENDPSWIEDEEPIPSTIDSWARGVVPKSSPESLETVVDVQRPPHVQDVAPSLPPTSQSRPVTNTSSLTTSTPAPPPRASSKPSLTRRKPAGLRPRPVARHTQARLVCLPHPPSSSLHPSSGGAAEKEEEMPVAPPLSCTPTSSLPTPSHSTPPNLPYGWKPSQLSWQKEVTYDDHGVIVDMIKLNPRRFPSHCVKPRVTVVPPSVGHPSNHTHRRQLDRTSRTVKRPVNERSMERRGGAEGGGRVMVRPGDAVTGGASQSEIMGKQNSRFPEVPTLPPLVDTITPLPGVTVREAGRTVSGPKSLQPRGLLSPRSHMHPLLPPGDCSHDHPARPVHVLASTVTT